MRSSDITPLSLMDIFDDLQESNEMTYTQIQNKLKTSDITVINRVANLLSELGLEVRDDILTEEDRQTLEQWRTLAGIGED
jgi:hypothetical protein